MLDLMTRLKVHTLAEGNLPQDDIAEACQTSLRSVQRILTESAPTQEEIVAGRRQEAPRMGRPSKASPEILEAIRMLLAQPGEMPATEVLRRSRELGYTGGKSQMSEIVRKLRAAPAKEPIVRFEGFPGEYAQFDFGECEVRFDAGVRTVTFFGGRLKYSRFMQVVLTPDQKAETLVRALLTSLCAFGGSPKEWVFDNPRTVRISKIGAEKVVLHRHLRQAVAEYRVIPTLCAPRSGNQKGSVERLVGYVKHSFLLVRKFKDMEDLQEQLSQWLQEVNFQRPCDATGIIPDVARQQEIRILSQRSVKVKAEEWAMEESVTVDPGGLIRYRGTRYATEGRHVGATATLLVRKEEIEIRVGDERVVHTRRDYANEVQRLPHQRQILLSLLHGRRKQSTFRRQCLHELGGAAHPFLGMLVHSCSDWEEPCNQLFDLLQDHGQGAMLDAFHRCVDRKTCTVTAVRQVLREAA